MSLLMLTNQSFLSSLDILSLIIFTKIVNFPKVLNNLQNIHRDIMDSKQQWEEYTDGDCQIACV